MADPVLVLHFTQGTTIAGAIDAMRKAHSECHEVVDPAMVGSEGMALTLQLLPWGTPARSLKHPAGRPETNNRGFTAGSDLGRCYQVEIVGRSEVAAAYPEWWYQHLADYLRDQCAKLGVPYTFPCPFVGNEGYGASARQRLSWAQWSTVAGIVGHQHVPGNEHWDPGALNMTRLTPGATTVPTTAPLPENDPGARIQRAINANGLQPPLKVDGDCRDRTADGLDKVLAYLNGLNAELNAQNADLRKANATSADTIKRLTEATRMQRADLETAIANREAAEAEAARLRAELQTGGRMPALLADLAAASKDLDQAANAIAEAITKARA